jgi:hypothetical protein
VAQLTSSRYLDPSQYAGTDKMLNLPPRTSTDVPPTEPEPGQGQQQGQDNQPPTQQQQQSQPVEGSAT